MIILFDLDSTISTIEGLDYLADLKGLGPKIKEITELTMSGKLNFDEAFPKKVEMLAPSKAEQEHLGKVYLKNFSVGLEDSLTKLSEYARLGILTANFKIPAEVVAQTLALDSQLRFANESEFDEKGEFAGFNPEQVLAKERGKGIIIKNLRNEFPEEKFIFVGDSAGDMISGAEADLFVGYGGVAVRERVQSESKYFIQHFSELEKIIQENFSND